MHEHTTLALDLLHNCTAAPNDKSASLGGNGDAVAHDWVRRRLTRAHAARMVNVRSRSRYRFGIGASNAYNVGSVRAFWNRYRDAVHGGDLFHG